MMISRRLFLVVINVAVLATAQQSNAPRTKTSDIVKEMRSSGWTDRSKAFEGARRILATGKRPSTEYEQLTIGLIELLTVENAATMVVLGKQTGGEDEDQGHIEEHEQYYSTLIGAVAQLADERAIPALLAAAPSGGMASRGVARFGERALDRVLEQVGSRDSQLASGAVDVLREMLKMHTITDRDSYIRLKNGLRSALASPEFDVRLSAIDAIEYLSDREKFVPSLEALAEHDPFNIAQPDNKWGATVFVVREDAVRLLRKIEAAGAQPANQ